jgi:hypothetical protein
VLTAAALKFVLWILGGKQGYLASMVVDTSILAHGLDMRNGKSLNGLHTRKSSCCLQYQHIEKAFITSDGR